MRSGARRCLATNIADEFASVNQQTDEPDVQCPSIEMQLVRFRCGRDAAPNENCRRASLERAGYRQSTGRPSPRAPRHLRCITSVLMTWDGTDSDRWDGSRPSLQQAATAAGLNKSTVLRAIKGGKISASRNEHGDWIVEPAELHRVYPPSRSTAVPFCTRPLCSQADY